MLKTFYFFVFLGKIDKTKRIRFAENLRALASPFDSKKKTLLSQSIFDKNLNSFLDKLTEVECYLKHCSSFVEHVFQEGDRPR